MIHLKDAQTQELFVFESPEVAEIFCDEYENPELLLPVGTF